MARRSSARLRNRSSTTPKRVSLSNDAPKRTPRTVPAKLASLNEAEDEDMPGAFPRSVSPPAVASPSAMRGRPAQVQDTRQTTPQKATPVKPSSKELHPDHYHQTTAKPHEDARWLGFSNMAPQTEPPKHSSRIATYQGTPTKAQVKQPEKSLNDLKSPDFKFTFQREHSLELSPEAKKLMLEKREEAANIRAQMAASGEKAQDIDEAIARKLATPKGKFGRFDEAHMKQFNKMESIAGHASSFRRGTSKIAITTPSAQQTFSTTKPTQQPSQGLKRSPSKAQFDQPSPAGAKLARSPSKPVMTQAQSQLPRSASTKNVHARNEESASPAKRMKRADGDDASSSRPLYAEGHEQPSTPQQTKPSKSAEYPDISHLTTPTQSSIARAKSATTSKIPGFGASPHKPAAFGTQAAAQPAKQPESLLSKSPSKMSLFGGKDGKQAEQPKEPARSLLSRSPFKGAAKTPVDGEGEIQQKPEEAPLLSRSPLKGSVAKTTEPDEGASKTSSIPFLARSPAKMSTTGNLFKTGDSEAITQTPGKQNNLMGRFNLLRASPVKSILRTPQRLYSDDPAKIAAGTHVATPEGKNSGIPSLALPKPPATAPARKHVDFSSSTKARHESAESTSTPSKSSTPPSKQPTEANTVEYPNLPSPSVFASPSPQKRRQTVAPGDFTFRAGSGAITFAPSPNAPTNTTSRRPSIRHVSAEPAIPPPPPATGSKKRKFDFENEEGAQDDSAKPGNSSEKENFTAAANASPKDDDREQDSRPAKRSKPNFAAPTAASKEKKQSATQDTSPAKRTATSTATTRMPTAGVRQKKDGKLVKEKTRPRPSVRPGGAGAGGASGGAAAGSGTTISQARLNALAMPKHKRGE
ncbi:hypothetical protein MBLNU230_g0344t1 [Neophaeotheca triangularis]